MTEHAPNATSAHADYNEECRGMPRSFLEAKDSVMAYAKQVDGAVTLVKYHLDNAMKAGLSPVAMGHVVKAYRCLEDWEGRQ